MPFDHRASGDVRHLVLCKRRRKTACDPLAANDEYAPGVAKDAKDKARTEVERAQSKFARVDSERDQ